MRKYSKQNKNFIVVVLYVISSITAIYTLFSIYNSYIYISGLVNNNGLVISEQLMSVVSYYINASMPYVFYTIAIWGIGYIIYKLDNLKMYETNSEDNQVEKDINIEGAEEDLDSFINELKSDNIQ
ncbi:acylphosphatase [Romboutsia hominis]|uniref:Uncharacterized protein n=1 Tax=Romboutsia hominis TaxID=1507512 RepID=A0A2P2BQA2_9FIRM|nr:acylphosphatase [Romboutsia hominis]MCH1959864.1 hypothetical protein [Romboutsia hominis]MCH1969713.1 hypothetical protein [Romboutsia hominis]CEI72528.1 Hypothetical protein FRIFI_0988 [Romboutsia hominis]